MIYSGLVSVTFRQLSAQDIIRLVCQAGLNGIEWGGDIHVPHGQVQSARNVRSMTEDAGLTIPSYGSYYRVGHEKSGPFESVLETAQALGAPIIRVWAGQQGTDSADKAYFSRVVEDSHRIAGLAKEAGIGIAYEFHGNTLTDSYNAAQKLLAAVPETNVTSYWQTPQHSICEENLSGLQALLPRLSHVHVFQWNWEPRERLALAEGEHAWQQYFQLVAATGRQHYAMLEFVKDDHPEQFLQDAAALKSCLS